MSFICTRMKNDFHIKGWAPALVLKQRPGETRKWPIRIFNIPARQTPGINHNIVCILRLETISSYGGEFESEVSSLIFWYDPRLTTLFDRCDLPSWRNRKKYIEHEFLGRVSGKFPGPPGTSGKVVLFSRTECSKRKCVFQWWNRIFDTSLKLSRPFYGEGTWFVQIVNTIPE